MSGDQVNQLLDSVDQEHAPSQSNPIQEVPNEVEVEQADVEASQILNSDKNDLSPAEQAPPPPINTTSVELKTRPDSRDQKTM